MTNLRGFLRQETHDLHETLDAIIGPFTTLADYDRFLIGSFRHRAAAEAVLCADADEVVPRPRRLVPTLQADLADRGLALPLVEPLDMSKDIASLLGGTYVLEGSALGARILIKSALSLGLNADHGARYLSAQAGSIVIWRELLVRLDTLDEGSWERAVRAARQVFAHAIQAFSLRELPAA